LGGEDLTRVATQFDFPRYRQKVSFDIIDDDPQRYAYLAHPTGDDLKDVREVARETWVGVDRERRR
jgi:hypothetical protein